MEAQSVKPSAEANASSHIAMQNSIRQRARLPLGTLGLTAHKKAMKGFYC
jgi:hypothetical protein